VTFEGQALLPGVVRQEGSDLALEVGGQTLWVRNCPSGHYELVTGEYGGAVIHALQQDGVCLTLETGEGSTHSHSFSRFVWDGNEGHVAVGVARLVSHAPSAVVFCGKSGVGKTHLLDAIANDMGAVSIHAETFTNHFISAIRFDRMPDFREKYRHGITVLLVDGLEFFRGKGGTQAEFLQTVERISSRGGTVVCTATDYPTRLGLEKPLESFLEGAMSIPVPALGVKGRKLLLRRWALESRVSFASEKAIEALASVAGNVGILRGVFTGLVARSCLLHQPIDLDMVSGALEVVKPLPMTPEGLIEKVAQCFQLSPEKLRGRGRDESVVRGRWVVAYLLRKRFSMGAPSIGRLLGKDTSTISYGQQRLDQLLKSDTREAREVRHLIARLLE
jgi:chromosomal replication initiator protein